MKTTSRLSISPATPRTIGRLLLAGAICWSGAPLFAQNQPPVPVPQSQPGSRALLTQEDLRELVGPIALYPDALIALILPASTVPSDVVLGARFVDGKGDPSQAGNQPWDESVRSLVYYPDVLSWMNENLEWTASLGEAFLDQPADVMNAIQGLRSTARASGALTDTPQQRVVVQQETIRIIPSDPEVIYVPQYDPEVVFVESYSPGYTPFITFGIGFAVGSWLNYDCDWGRRYVYRGDWNRGGWDRDRWDRGGDVFINNNNVNVNVVNINSNNAVRWNPSNRSMRQLELRQRNGGGNARFTTAEARAAREMIRTERRQNNGRLPANALAAARREALPAPGKLQLREAAYNRAVRAQDRTNRNETAETLAEARRNRDSATPNRPIAENRRKTPTEAPRVNGQLEAARQARREENRRDAAETRQNVRQQFQDRQAERPNQVPTRAPRVDSDMPSQRPSVSERQRENRQSVQDFRQERQESRSQRQEARQERPQQRQEVRQPQPQRQEARPQQQRQEVRQHRQEQRQVNRPEQRERAERPQQQRQERQQQRQERPQQRQERPQQRQEVRQQQRQEARPQRQEARQQRQEQRSEKREERKKKD
jgi:hypothetical protein